MNSPSEASGIGSVHDLVAGFWSTLPGSHAHDPLPSQAALWISLLTLVATLLLMASIVILHLRNGWVERRRKRWSDLWLLQLLDPEEHGAIAPIRIPQFVPFALLWNHVHDSMRGEMRRSLIKLSRKAGAADLALERLQRGSMAEKILSATFLGNHLDNDAVVALSAFASSSDPFLSLPCARALVKIAPTIQLPRLLPDFLRREDWPFPLVHDILSTVDPDILSSHLPGVLLRWYPEPSPRAIRSLALVHEDVRTSLIDAIFQRTTPPSPEAEAALLREIHDPAQLPLVRRGLESPHWSVIVAALNRLVNMGSREDVPRLTELLGHKEWWVRYRAARVLVMLPDMKPIEVELLATRHADRYGREMLRYALAERNLQ